MIEKEKNLEAQMYEYLDTLRKNKSFEGIGDPPIYKPDCVTAHIYRSKSGDKYLYGTSCGMYEISCTGQWVVNGRICPAPLGVA